MTSTNSEEKPPEQSEEKPPEQSSEPSKLEYQILDETYQKYDLTFKIIVIGNSGI